MPKSAYTLSELSQHIQAELRGDGSCLITGIAPLQKAKAGQISFLSSSRYKKFLSETQASAVIVSAEDVTDCPATAAVLILKNPSAGFAKLAALFEYKPNIPAGIHPTAVIGKNTQIAATASIGAHCVIGDHVQIGEGTVIHPGVIIGDYVSIGADCLLWSHVTLYHHVTLGKGVIIHSGVVLGSDGFGLTNEGGVWQKIPQLGGVWIGDYVEIGANTTVDRGALEDTVIETGVKLDNLIQIAHNVHVGAHTAIAACTVIAGSTHIGKYCMIAGAVSINGHIEICDQVIITACATVLSSITEPGVYSSGFPAHPNREWRKNAVRILQLDQMARRLRKLEELAEKQ